MIQIILMILMISYIAVLTLTLTLTLALTLTLTLTLTLNIILTSFGFPHSSHSVTVSGIDGSLIVFATSTKGTSATMHLKRVGYMKDMAPKG